MDETTLNVVNFVLGRGADGVLIYLFVQLISELRRRQTRQDALEDRLLTIILEDKRRENSAAQSSRNLHEDVPEIR